MKIRPGEDSFKADHFPSHRFHRQSHKRRTGRNCAFTPAVNRGARRHIDTSPVHRFCEPVTPIDIVAPLTYRATSHPVLLRIDELLGRDGPSKKNRGTRRCDCAVPVTEHYVGIKRGDSRIRSEEKSTDVVYDA